MVTILVLGGTGPTGQALIKEAIVRKYTVVIFARSPQKLPEEISLHPLVIVVSGYLEDEGAVRKAFTVPCRTGRNDKHSDEHGGAAECTHTTEIHIDAVVSALGPPVMKIHPSGHPIAKGYERVVRIGKEYGVSRFIVLGTASITDSADRFDARFKALVLGVRIFAPHAYEEVVEIGKVFAALDDADWTIVRVPVLTSPRRGHYTAGYIGDGQTNIRLPRPLFANFVLDEVERPKWIRKRPLVSIVT